MTDSADASVGSRDPQLDELAREIALRRQAEEKLRQALARQRSAEEALQNSEDRFARFMQHFPGLAWIKDADGRYVYANDAAVQAFQCERESLYGKTDDEIFPSETAAQFKANDLRARASAAGVRVTETLMQKDGELHYSVVSKFPIPGPDAAPDMVGGMAVDVTERRRAEQDAQFLAAASVALADVADYESTLQTVAQLAVPSFADWCAVYLLDADGSLRQLAVAHIGPDKVTLAGDLQHRRPPEPAAARGAWKIVRTGRSDIVPDVSNEPAALESLDATQLSLIRELGLRSYLGAPLSVRGKTFGAMTFFSAESARRYGPEDLAMARDLAHRAAIAIENARLYQALKDADRRKDEFLALLGHELRNPLAPICNALHVLKLPGADTAITERAREMIERQIEQMVRLVDDLLDVSRIMRGQVELRREPIELATIIARAVETSQPCIDAERHRLTVGMPPDPLWLHGDLVRLAQVVSNLLNNAAKYTERGGEIRLEAAREQDQAVVRVRDNGIGIAAETLPRLFDMFYQAERRTRQSQGGLGIGLSLVRRLVELHGGNIEAQSAGRGAGSEFVVRLPLQESHQSEARSRPANVCSAAPRLPPRRILVVDDNIDAADSLATLLRLQGQAVDAVYDGPSALAKAEQVPPDAAFLDLGMPNMDGYALASAFRAHPKLKHTLLIALTGWGQPEDRQRTADAGFDFHLVKPVAAEALYQVLHERA